MSEDKRIVNEMISLSKDMSRLSKQALDNALADYPGNHFSHLEKLYIVIKECGKDDSISASELAQYLSIAPSALSRELRNLEADSVIVRRLDPSDRRKTLISISKKGEEERMECEKAVCSYFKSIIEIIGEDDLWTLCRIHRKAVEALHRRNSEWTREHSVAQANAAAES